MHAFFVIVLSFLSTKRMHSPRRKVSISEGGWEWGGSFSDLFRLDLVGLPIKTHCCSLLRRSRLFASNVHLLFHAVNLVYGYDM